MEAATVDVRLENWRLVVPEHTSSMLVLPVEGARSLQDASATVVASEPAALEQALRESFDGVVAQDLAAWGALSGDGAPGLLRRLAEATADGGWLYAAFPSATWPRKPRGMTLARALRTLRTAGFTEVAAYAALPDHRRPAWLVPVGRRAELDVFLRRLAFAYVPFGPPMVARAAAQVFKAGRKAGLAAPHRLRVRLAPAYAVVGRRPS